MKIGILTSGGDCPGINATIRGVCKTAINHYGMEVVGIHSGFQGLLTKEVESFTEKSLSGLLNLGGTMLGTSREKPFRKQGIISDVDKPALIQRNIAELGLDCVVCIGGNGTQKTAAKFAAMTMTRCMRWNAPHAMRRFTSTKVSWRMAQSNAPIVALSWNLTLIVIATTVRAVMRKTIDPTAKRFLKSKKHV